MKSRTAFLKSQTACEFVLLLFHCSFQTAFGVVWPLVAIGLSYVVGPVKAAIAGAVAQARISTAPQASSKG